MGIGGAVLGGALSAGTSLLGSSRSRRAAERAGDVQAQAAMEATQLQREIFEQGRADLAPFRAVGVSALDVLADLFLPGGSQVFQLEQDLREAQEARATQAANISRLRAAGNEERARQIEAELPQMDAFIMNTFNTISNMKASGVAPDRSAFFKSPSFQFRQREGEGAVNRFLASRGLADSGRAGRALTEFSSDLASQEFGNFANRLAQLAGIGQAATNVTVSAGQQFGQSAGQNILDAGTARASSIIAGQNALNRGLEGAVFSLSDPSFLSGVGNLLSGRTARTVAAGTPQAPAFTTGGALSFAPGTTALF